MNRAQFILLLGCWLMLVSGCARPNPVTIALRKENQQLQDKLEKLQYREQADRAQIEAFQSRVGSLKTLPESRLDAMFTTHSIELGRLTGGARINPDATTDQALRIYLTPLDDNGDPTKATGKVTVDAFDLSLAHDNRIGHWVFEPLTMKNDWRSLGPLHAFVLICPLQTVPRHAEITIKVTFQDELTGRVFSAVKDVRIILPASTTQPATLP